MSSNRIPAESPAPDRPLSDSETSGAPTAKRAIVRSASTSEAAPVSAGTATTSQVLLGAEDGMPHFAMRRFRMGEGGGMPLHTNQVEHEQYVLRGKARVVIDDEEHVVAPNDVLYIPAGSAHSYTVLEPPFEFLCLVPNLEDRIDLV